MDFKNEMTPNYLNKLVEERDQNMKAFQELVTKYRATESMSTLRRLNERIARIKVLNNRIARLGERYQIVKVIGMHLANTGSISIFKSFELYYTEISEYDATCKANLHFKGQTKDIKTFVIPTGTDTSQHFFK